MGGIVPGTHISKGPLCYYLDELSRRPDARLRLAALRDAICDLESDGYEGFVEVFRKHVFEVCDTPRTEMIVKYLDKNWFNERQGWWPHLQPLEPVFCVGLIKTIDVAIEQSQPIDSYWVIVEDGFEMTITQSPQQVTLLIMTPEPANPRAYGVWAPNETNIWVIKDDRLGGELAEETRWHRRVSENSKGVASRGRAVTVQVNIPDDADDRRERVAPEQPIPLRGVATR